MLLYEQQNYSRLVRHTFLSKDRRFMLSLFDALNIPCGQVNVALYDAANALNRIGR